MNRKRKVRRENKGKDKERNGKKMGKKAGKNKGREWKVWADEGKAEKGKEEEGE